MSDVLSMSRLNETVRYIGDTSMGIGLYKIDYYPLHLHEDIEVIFVVRGQLHIKCSLYDLEVAEGDLTLINGGDLHEYTGQTGDDVVIILHINVPHYEKYFPDLNRVVFATDSSEFENIKKIEHMLWETLLLTRSDKRERNELLHSSAEDIIRFLMNNLMFSSREDEILRNMSKYKNKKRFHMERIHRIVDYMYINYASRITLESLAGQVHIDKYYLSHILRYATGESFQVLLTLIRIEEAEKKLLGTDDFIETISANCGFSSSTFFSKKFKEVLGDTPSRYRKMTRPRLISNSEKRVSPVDVSRIPISPSYSREIGNSRIIVTVSDNGDVLDVVKTGESTDTRLDYEIDRGKDSFKITIY